MRSKSEPDDIPEFGHFSDPALVILTCLADGPKHGYAIILQSQALGMPLGLGTLYGTLNRLERFGMIEALPPQQRRRPYQLTEAGIDHLRGRLASLGEIVRYGSQKLGEAT